MHHAKRRQSLRPAGERWGRVEACDSPQACPAAVCTAVFDCCYARFEGVRLQWGLEGDQPVGSHLKASRLAKHPTTRFALELKPPLVLGATPSPRLEELVPAPGTARWCCRAAQQPPPPSGLGEGLEDAPLLFPIRAVGRHLVEGVSKAAFPAFYLKAPKERRSVFLTALNVVGGRTG